MRSAWGGIGMTLLTLAVGLTLGGCRRSDEQRAQDTARAFLEAAQRGDKEATKTTLTKKARENVDSGNGVKIEKQEKHDFTVGQATVEGDTAQVPVTFQENGQEKSIKLKLRREENEWRVYALAFPMNPGGTEFTLDFENPESAMSELLGRAFSEGVKTFGEGMGRAVKGFAEGFQKGLGENTSGSKNP